jgi:ABC-type nitrate/sulfonate/bicarbonate transport system substrate-binding protein
MRTKIILCAIAGALALHGVSQAAAAEIRLARQFSMGYLQLNVMEHQQLIEKHAKALGLNDVKVSWFTFNGPTAVNEALISSCGRAPKTRRRKCAAFQR